MLVNEKAPDTDFYFTSGENRFNKVLGVLGHNASGKTSLLRAVSFLSWFMVGSFALRPDDNIPIKPFFYDKKMAGEPSCLEVIFEIKDKIYRYEVCLTPKKIISEELKHKTNSGYRVLFSRTNDENGKKYNLKNFNLDKDFELIVNKRDNASLLSVAYQIEHKQSKEIIEYWKSVYNVNISESGKITSSDIFASAKYYKKHEDIKKKVENLLKRFDLGLDGVKIKKVVTEDDEDLYLPFGIHPIKNDKDEIVEMPFVYESGGTQNLFVTLKDIVQVLNTGGVVVFDEIDADLHPLIVLDIIGLFSDKTINRNNAQLIFSTHSLLVLDNLDKYQIQFTEKGNDGESKTQRLDQIKGVRMDDNYLKKYLLGLYGALPAIKK